MAWKLQTISVGQWDMCRKKNKHFHLSCPAPAIRKIQNPESCNKDITTTRSRSTVKTFIKSIVGPTTKKACLWGWLHNLYLSVISKKIEFKTILTQNKTLWDLHKLHMDLSQWLSFSPSLFLPHGRAQSTDPPCFYCQWKIYPASS